MDKRPIAIDGRYIQDHFPGIGRYTYNLVLALAEEAPDQPFCLLHNPRLHNTRYDIQALARYPNVDLQLLPVPTMSLAEQFHLPLAIRQPASGRTQFAIRNSQFAILHSPYYIKPYWLPCPSVLTVYDLIPRLYPQYLPSRWSRLIFEVTMRLALRAADRVITISHSARDDLVRLYDVPAEKITVTHLAADERFRPDADRRKYGLPEQYVLYFGINKPHKNLLRLVEAWSLVWLQSAIRNPQLVIAGAWDPRYPQVKTRVAELGLQDSVVFLGPVPDEDLPDLYRGAALFVFPSLYEGFGLPVLEAMACGTPVVCSNTSSLPEIVGDAALTFDPTDVDDMAQTTARALADEDLREGLRQRGMARARQFTWQRTARETLAVYRQVLACPLAGNRV